MVRLQNTAEPNFGKEAGMSQRDFDTMSLSWDQEPRRQRLAADIAKGVQAYVPLGPDLHLLDYGCGTGLVSLHLLPLVGQITGLDSSSGMLSVFAGKLSAADRNRVSLSLLDLTDGGRFTGDYDIILCAMLLHHVPDPASLIRRLSSHLSPGGHLCIADLNAEDGSFHDDPTGICHHGFDRYDVSTWIRDSGLTLKAMETVSVIEKPSKGDNCDRIYPVFLAVASV
jgi:2-polyprenyl-3-methyl-5-hydroxy-6-metoxy-1,4-benzoquinol methylase